MLINYQYLSLHFIRFVFVQSVVEGIRTEIDSTRTICFFNKNNFN